jgi:N-acetyl sugar amidotransferase
MDQKYKICTNCVMDTSDPAITFDEQGVCNHCEGFRARKDWFPGDSGQNKLQALIESIKAEGKGKEYDCILGLSGGVDSSYLALKAYEWGLRPLVFHVDAGWNSELAVANIEKVVKHCGYDLHTHVVDWETMRGLHLAFLNSGIANQDIPQDHIFLSSQYHFAIKNNIRTIFSGGNLATESIFPTSWHNDAMDSINLLDIHQKFTGGKPRNYQTINMFQYYFWYPIVLKMRTVRPLNFMDFNKEAAITVLEDVIGWRSYGRKHGESIFTKLFQNHILPTRFGYDKRRPHLSSLIMSGQLTREEATTKLLEPLYNVDELEQDIEYFCKKLRIDRLEFDRFMTSPLRSYKEFRNWDRMQKAIKFLQATAERITGKRLRVYS